MFKVFFLCSDCLEPFSESESLSSLLLITLHPIYDQSRYLKSDKRPSIK